MAAKGPKPPTPAEVAVAEAQRLTSLWISVRGFFAKAVTDDAITREDEQAFLEAKSEVSKLQRTLSSKMPEGIKFAADRMQDLLRQSISLQHLRALPKADRQNLLATWHHVFIWLSQATGALQCIAEGYKYDPATRSKKAVGTQLSDLKGAAASASKSKEPSALANPKLWIAIALIGGALFYIGRKMQWF
jgi:hypothetical protein